MDELNLIEEHDTEIPTQNNIYKHCKYKNDVPTQHKMINYRNLENFDKCCHDKCLHDICCWCPDKCCCSEKCSLNNCCPDKCCLEKCSLNNCYSDDCFHKICCCNDNCICCCPDNCHFHF